MSHPVAPKDQIADVPLPLITEVGPPHAKFKIVRDAVVNYSGTAVSGIVGFIMVPILLRGLGTENYGFWILALAVGSFAPLDLGLGWSLAREVAADHDYPRQETIGFVLAAARFYLLIGAAGAVCIALLGLPLSHRLGLSAQTATIAPWIFCLAGLSFFGDHILGFAICILHGLRRFGAANILSISIVLLRALGSLVLLSLGGQLLAVAFWQSLVLIVMVAAGIGWIMHIQPEYARNLRYRSRSPLMSVIRVYLPFGIKSQFVLSATNVVWQSTSFIVGILRGPSAVVPYHLGQRFPLMISNLNWRAADPLFPAASQAPGRDDCKQLLEMGSRWILSISVPLCALLFVLAPELLNLWLGYSSSDTVSILRVMTGVALADAVGVGAMHVLWAMGKIRLILRVSVTMAIATIVISSSIIAWSGVANAVWGILIPMVVGSVLFLHFASRECGTNILAVLNPCAGVLLSGFICAFIAFTLSHFVTVEGSSSTVGIAVVAMIGYVITLYLFGTTPEEKLWVKNLL